jgi:hypothetical protein
MDHSIKSFLRSRQTDDMLTPVAKSANLKGIYVGKRTGNENRAAYRYEPDDYDRAEQLRKLERLK